MGHPTARGRADAPSVAGARRRWILPAFAPSSRADTPSGPAEHPPLTTRGLYGFVRHPLYFAWALFVFATPTMTGTRAAFAVISTAYLMIAIPWEERDLVATFGQEYEAYRRRVKTRMIPGCIEAAGESLKSDVGSLKLGSGKFEVGSGS